MDQLQASGLDSKTAAAIRNEIRSAIETAFQEQAAALPSQLQGTENWPTNSGNRVNWITVGITIAATALVLGFIYWQITDFSERMQTEFALILEEIAKLRTEIGNIREELACVEGRCKAGRADSQLGGIGF